MPIQTSPSLLLRSLMSFALVVAAVGLASADELPVNRTADLRSKAFLKTATTTSFAPTRVLVRFEADATDAAKAQASVNAGANRIRSFRALDGLEVWEVASGAANALQGIRNNPNVMYAELDPVMRKSFTPNDRYYGQMWGLNQSLNFDINAPQAWDSYTGDPDYKIAIIDSGVDYTHPDLAANIWTNDDEAFGMEGVDDDGNGYIDDIRGWDFFDVDNTPMDGEIHGTHTGGTVGAVGNNGIGTAGVNWTCKLVPLRFLGPHGGTISDAVLALQYCIDKGILVSNNSYGGSGYSQAFQDMLGVAEGSGHMFVAAAGNDAKNNDVIPSYPTNHTGDNVISVASLASDGRLSSFSNYGLVTVDIAAPGSNIFSTVPKGYQYLSGTSMASPHVAGVVAMIMSLHPEYSLAQVRTALFGASKVLTSLNGRVATGATLDLENALRPVLGFFNISPFSIHGSLTAVGDLSLSQPAPPGGVTVQLSSNNAVAIVPPSADIVEGDTIGNFNIDTVNNTYNTVTATITAKFNKTVTKTIQVKPSNVAQFIDQNVPAAMVAGQRYYVSMRFLNDGGVTWSTAQGYKLLNRSGVNWTTSALPLLATTAPGQIAEFAGYVWAPTTAGNYSFLWKPNHAASGDFEPSNAGVVIPVTLQAQAARFMTQTVPTTVNAGNDFTGSLVFKNVGTALWNTAGGYGILSRNPDSNTTWGTDFVPISSTANVAQGSTTTFSKVFTAPITPGQYTFNWSLFKTGFGAFGDISNTVTINVVNGTRNADFISSSGIPVSVPRNGTFSASITMKNVGTGTWTSSSGYVLGSRGPTGNTFWGTTQLSLPASVAPGGSVTFTRTFTAPATPGVYNFQWRMKQGTISFGQDSGAVNITVT